MKRAFTWCASKFWCSMKFMGQYNMRLASVYFMLVAVYLCLLVCLVFSWWLIMFNFHTVYEVLVPVYKYTILHHCSRLTMAISVATQDRLPLRKMKHILSQICNIRFVYFTYITYSNHRYFTFWKFSAVTFIVLWHTVWWAIQPALLLVNLVLLHPCWATRNWTMASGIRHISGEVSSLACHTIFILKPHSWKHGKFWGKLGCSIQFNSIYFVFGRSKGGCLIISQDSFIVETLIKLRHIESKYIMMELWNTVLILLKYIQISCNTWS